MISLISLLATLTLVGGDGCCAAQAKETAAKTPLIEKADGLLAKWVEASKPVELTAEEKASEAKAKETLAQLCPVCKNMPETATLLLKTMACSMAIEEKAAKSGMGEGNALMLEHRTLMTRSNQLVTAMFSSFGMKGASCCKAEGGAEAKKACCEKESAEGGKEACKESEAECLGKLTKSADALIVRWEGVPAAFAALPAEDMAKVMGAMNSFKKKGGCELAHPTALAASEMTGRILAIEAEMSKSCEAKKTEGEAAGCPEMAAAKKELCDSMHARNALLKKTQVLLAKMGSVFDPNAGKAAKTASAQ